jgi:YD repeat-containing protein
VSSMALEAEHWNAPTNRAKNGNYLFELVAQPGGPEGRSHTTAGSWPILETDRPRGVRPSRSVHFLRCCSSHLVPCPVREREAEEVPDGRTLVPEAREHALREHSGKLLRARWTGSGVTSLLSLWRIRQGCVPPEAGSPISRRKRFERSGSRLTRTRSSLSLPRPSLSGELASARASEDSPTAGTRAASAGSRSVRRRPYSGHTRYDANGNRISDPTGTSTYDEQDRLLTHADDTFTYTANGELATRTAGGGATSEYEYDPLGNLRRVFRPSPAATLTYAIDGQASF